MCNISTPFQGQRLISQTTVELGEGVRKCGNKLFSSLSLTLLFWPRSTFPCMPRSPWNAFPLTRMQSGRLCEPSCEVQFSYQLFARHLGNLIHVIRRVIVVYTDVHITIKIHCWCLQALVHWCGFHAARGESEWCIGILLWCLAAQTVAAICQAAGDFYFP